MATVYVSRDASGRITGVYANRQPGYATEALDDASAEVLAFRNPLAARAAAAFRERRFRRRLKTDPVRALVERAESDRSA